MFFNCSEVIAPDLEGAAQVIHKRFLYVKQTSPNGKGRFTRSDETAVSASDARRCGTSRCAGIGFGDRPHYREIGQSGGWLSLIKKMNEKRKNIHMHIHTHMSVCPFTRFVVNDIEVP